jgi:hypothetical protein
MQMPYSRSSLSAASLQPGGSFIDDGAPTSPFTVFNAKEPAEVDDIKKYIEVLNKLIRRFNPSFSTLSIDLS